MQEFRLKPDLVLTNVGLKKNLILLRNLTRRVEGEAPQPPTSSAF
jgi:hypothetical protein